MDLNSMIIIGGFALFAYKVAPIFLKNQNSGITQPPRIIERDPPAPEYMKAQVRARANHRCEGCGHHFKGTLDVHHIKPRSVGGRNTLNNLIALCPNCHRIAHSKR